MDWAETIALFTIFKEVISLFFSEMQHLQRFQMLDYLAETNAGNRFASMD